MPDSPMTRADNPDRLIPVIPNDLLLSLILNANMAIEARVSPTGWEYVNIEFWQEDVETSIVIGWAP